MPNKWADYAVVAVSYTSDNTHIECLKVRPDLGDKFGNAEFLPRSSVVNSITSGKTFITAYQNSEHKWKRGDNISIIIVSGIKYLRTDGNSRNSDNLGELPRIQDGKC